jgi:hypothetical protein
VKPATYYHGRAEECRERAIRAAHPQDKAGWLQLAEDWRKLARSADELAAQRGLDAALSAVNTRERPEPAA